MNYFLNPVLNKKVKKNDARLCNCSISVFMVIFLLYQAFSQFFIFDVVLLTLPINWNDVIQDGRKET